MKKVYIRMLYLFTLIIFGFSYLYAGSNPALQILTPSIGQEYKTGDTVVIAISIFDEDGDVELSKIGLFVDGKDVTQMANVSVFLVTYTIEDIKDTGKHTFKLEVSDREGNQVEKDGYFYVQKRKIEKRVFSASGYIKAGGEYNGGSSEETVGNLTLNMYGNFIEVFDYTLNLEVTNQKNSEKQRVSSYRLDIASPIGRFVLGDTTPSFTTYSINGQRVFGVHLLPQFGPFGFEIVYGQSYKAVEDLEIYKRMVTGGKLKIGNPDGVIWGLSVLKVKDDTSSLSTTPQNTTPKDNLILSTDFSAKILNSLVMISLEANESLLNEDITAGASDFSGFDLPIDPAEYEWLFTINEHIVPIMPGLSNLAAKGSVTLGPLFYNTLYFEYFYVGPSYYSLANSGITNDLSGFKVSDIQWLIDRKLYLNGSYQNSWNNLEDTQNNTTKSRGYSLAVSGFPNDYLTLNGGFNLLDSNNGADIDTINLTIDAGATQNVALWDTNSYISFSTGVNIYKDSVNTSNDSKRYSVRGGLTSYFYSIPLSTKGVVGYDFGTENSFYLEGWGEYRFLADESLIGSLGIVYTSGDGMFDVKSNINWDAFYDVKVESSFEYITNTGDLNISVFATRKF